jgi:RNA polymerase sigma factor (TIGR02999 family)
MSTEPPPSGSTSGEVTLLLRQWTAGQPDALDSLAPIVYQHLHRIAQGYLSRERGGHTLQATGLVNEVFLRLLADRRADWQDRGHFYSFAARMMRRILIDHARAVRAGKRGGEAQKIPLAAELAWIDAQGPEILDLDTALNDLEAMDPKKARAVELRYFLGCTAEETAEIMEVSKATIDRELRFTRSWLVDRLNPPGGADSHQASL